MREPKRLRGSKERREEGAILIALLLFALLFRLVTLMPIHSGVDERDYWTAAKALVQGTEYPALTHRTVRIAVILPVALFQLILGTGPNVYYVTPVLNTLAQVALAYFIGRKIRGRLTGVLGALALVLFPYMIRAGSQVRPEIFSMTYILAAILCLLEYLGRRERWTTPLLLSAAFIFLAYESKITNLFFLPGFALAILLAKRRPAHALLFSGFLFGLYLAETAAYALFTDFPGGQLQVILGSHLSDDVPDVTLGGFADLFKRYARPYLQPYWQAPFAAFAIAAAYYLSRKAEAAVKALIAVSASFFFFVTFAVKSLSPLLPAEDFINRYFCAVLGPVFLVLAAAASDLLAAALKKDWKPRPILVAGSAAAIVAAVLAYLGAVDRPDYAREFGASPLRPADHPLVRNGAYRLIVNEAYTTGVPIVAVDSSGGANALSACEAYFLDRAEEKPARIAFEGNGGVALVAWGRPEALDRTAESVIAAVRNPHRLKLVPLAELDSLTDTRFPGEPGARKKAED